ncbi:unnamed protein product, partial [Nesidiocoris tenuis]
MAKGLGSVDSTLNGFLGRFKASKSPALSQFWILRWVYPRGSASYNLHIVFCRRVEGMRRNRAAVKIQTCVRRWVKQTQYERTRRTVLGLQRYARGHLARLKFQEMRRNRAEEGLALLKKNEAEILQENERFRAEIVKLESVVDSIKTQKEGTKSELRIRSCSLKKTSSSLGLTFWSVRAASTSAVLRMRAPCPSRMRASRILGRGGQQSERRSGRPEGSARPENLQRLQSGSQFVSEYRRQRVIPYQRGRRIDSGIRSAEENPEVYFPRFPSDLSTSKMVYFIKFFLSRQLESERQNDLMRWNIEREELVGELERVRAELERLRDIVAGNLDPNSSTKAEAFLRSEVTRLTAEAEQGNSREIPPHFAGFFGFAVLFENAGGNFVSAVAVEQQEDESAVAHKQLTTQASLPVIKKKERDEYMGMFEISSEEIEVFMRHLLGSASCRNAAPRHSSCAASAGQEMGGRCGQIDRHVQQIDVEPGPDDGRAQESAARVPVQPVEHSTRGHRNPRYSQSTHAEEIVNAPYCKLEDLVGETIADNVGARPWTGVLLVEFLAPVLSSHMIGISPKIGYCTYQGALGRIRCRNIPSIR